MKAVTTLLLTVSLLSASDTLRITLGHQPKTPIYQIAERFTGEINSKLDSTLTLKIYYKPHGRALMNLCDGETDGDFFRIEEVYPHCPDVIKIPVTLLSDTNYAYCSDSYEPTGPHPDSSTRYICILGSRAVLLWREKNDIPVHEVHSHTQALQMISLGRKDCFIASNVYETDSLFSHMNITRSGEPLFSESYYLFLNKKHERHVGQLTKVLYELTEGGFLRKLLNGEIQ